MVAELFRVEREEFRMVLPLVLHEDRIRKNLFHVRDVPLAGGAFRLAVPVLDGARRTGNGFWHGIVVRGIECPPDRLRAETGGDIEMSVFNLDRNSPACSEYFKHFRFFAKNSCKRGISFLITSRIKFRHNTKNITSD